MNLLAEGWLAQVEALRSAPDVRTFLDHGHERSREAQIHIHSFTVSNRMRTSDSCQTASVRSAASVTANGSSRPPSSCSPARAGSGGFAFRAHGGLARLSLNNQLLVALSCPEAIFVAGFGAWLKLGYCARTGT